ncbi:MAG: HAD hydrolase-like protein, partial [Actinobacteria bacterium]|nr:HAD hydrolase-like protein [Actinomycetota bacterium]
VLVLTGDARREDVEGSKWKPTYIVDDLTGLV